jgi:hypothetical protein
VFAFSVGLAGMVVLAYGDKTEIYLTDVLDAQKLYNAARNVEIAAWKLANARDAQGQLLLLSNEGAGDVQNLSFEREFGKLIAYQDVMAQIAAHANRTIRARPDRLPQCSSRSGVKSVRLAAVAMRRLTQDTRRRR